MSATQTSYALFDTPIGRCAIVWGHDGILGLQLPEARETATRQRVQRDFSGVLEAPPSTAARRAIDRITGLLRGEPSDLSDIALDLERVPPFHRKVYEFSRRIAPGKTMTYGEVAAQMGSPGSARAVGHALGRNPFALIVPCHRVLAAGGKIGGFSANGGVATKLKLLAIEGAQGSGTSLPLFEGDGAFGFDPQEAIEHLCAADAAIARVIERAGPFRMALKQTPSIFVALAESIVYQQLSGRAAATIYGRVCALFPQAHAGPQPAHILRASDEKLRGAGLSGAKTLALRDLARRAVDGSLPTLSEAQKMDNDTIIERLTEVRGIGRWTVEMLLMFRLGRPDVLPADDLGIRKGLAVALKKRALPTRDEVLARGARWQPYRTVASWYLWRATEFATRP